MRGRHTVLTTYLHLPLETAPISCVLFSQTYFNSSLEQCRVPMCFKTLMIIPIPKKSKVSTMNDYRPVTLTSVVMKVFERIVLRYLKTVTAGIMDPLQFAYQTNRSVDDAVALALHYMLAHLERPGTYVRVLFIDFSSAFNTIIPFKLFDKLTMLNVHPTICHWILDFLLHRSQSVRVNGSISSPVIINTGAPQGCVLSPFLFTLFTNDCVSGDQSVRLITFSDDATLIGCIDNADETAYRGRRKFCEMPLIQPTIYLNCSSQASVIEALNLKQRGFETVFIWKR